MKRGILCFIYFLAFTPAHASDASHYVRASARLMGVPVGFALKISHMESGTKCGVHNQSSGATGPMQIMPSTARKLGYRNIRASSCSTQVQAGMKYLAYCLKLTNHNHYKAARCYTGGPGGMRTKNARIHSYALKAIQ